MLIYLWENPVGESVGTIRRYDHSSRRKLRMVNNAQDGKDLRIPSANRLEKLKDDLQEYYNIRINNQWRIIFKWINNDAYEIQIVDYH